MLQTQVSKLAQLITASLVAVTVAGAANAATFTLTGDVDARIRDVDNVPVAASGNEVFLNSGGFRTNTILEFDLSFVPAGETITSILLSMTSIAASNTLFVNGYSGNGILETADAFESANSLGTFAITPGSNGPFALSTGYLNSLITGGATHFGLNIGIFNPQTSSSISDFSVEFNTAPATVPLPAAALPMALVLGGIGVAGYRRKRKAA